MVASAQKPLIIRTMPRRLQRMSHRDVLIKVSLFAPQALA